MSTGFFRTEVADIRTLPVESYRDIRPKKEISVRELNNAVKDEINNAKENLFSGGQDTERLSSEKNIDPRHKDCLTSSEERKELASYSKGDWDGEIGDSLFIPEKAEAREALTEYKQKGIEYKDGEPDFSKVSEATVEINDMTPWRAYNFKQANEACAKQWNEQKREGRSDWTARDVDDWRRKNNYSWHERLDMKTMDLVQRDIHEECKHYGGVAECRRMEALNGGGFDD